MRRFIEGFVATLCIAALLGFFVRMHSLAYWGVALITAVVLGTLRSKGGEGGAVASLGGEFLCDSCRYNHPNTCSLPERPNATRCADYRRRGG